MLKREIVSDSKMTDRRSARRRGSRNPQHAPIRVLTAVPICDGHDSAINTVNLEFIRHGIEVVYLGYHRSARDIVRFPTLPSLQWTPWSCSSGPPLRFGSSSETAMPNR